MLVIGSFGGCNGNKLKLMEIKRKSLGQNILKSFLGKKMCHCDFSLLGIIFQQKLLVCILVFGNDLNLREPLEKDVGQSPKND